MVNVSLKDQNSVSKKQSQNRHLFEKNVAFLTQKSQSPKNAFQKEKQSNNYNENNNE